MKNEFDKNKLLEEAISNIRGDREVTNDLLYELRDDIHKGRTNHSAVGLTAAKYVETLQRSNEQLVKIIAMMEKKDSKEEKIDKDSLYDMIKDKKEL